MKSSKIKKVLIALDYDATSQKVAETGYEFGKALGAEIILLHVVLDPIFYTATYIDYVDMDIVKLDSVNGLKSASQYFLDKTKDYLKDANIKTVVNNGDFAETILKTAKDLQIDIIVIGSHSHRWLENILVGSVTEQVLKNSKIPLFIVPTKKHQ